MGNKCRIGFVGCGRVAENHKNSIARCAHAELVAISNWRMPHAQEVSDAWGIPCMTPEALCASPDIDAVFVLTNSQSHFKYVKMALEGKKHVLVEKPVALDYLEVAEMARLAAVHGRLCVPGHSYIYLPELLRMKRVMDEGGIGTPVSMFMREIYRMPDHFIPKYSGPIREVLCHQIYLMLAYMGIPREVSAFAGCFRPEIRSGDEHVSVNIAFDSGAMAHLYVSWANEDETVSPDTFKVKLLGTGGGMEFSRRGYVRYMDGWLDYPMYDEMFDCEVAYFVDLCLGSGNALPSTMEDAVMSIRILDAVLRSVENHSIETISF